VIPATTTAVITHVSPISTETIVPQHKRITSKSQHDVLQQLAELKAALTELKFSSVPQNTMAHPDMTKHYKEAASLLAFIQGLVKKPNTK
jgi:ribosomal protein L29